MAASKHDFSIEQGASFQLSLTYKDANNDPINLTGWCARYLLKTNNGDTIIYTTENLDYSEYKFTIEEVDGKLILLLPASSTNDFDFNMAKYDLELSSPSDLYTGGGKYTVRLLYGTILIVKRFSQANTQLEC
jgi:hypothetical protein